MAAINNRDETIENVIRFLYYADDDDCIALKEAINHKYEVSRASKMPCALKLNRMQAYLNSFIY